MTAEIFTVRLVHDDRPLESKTRPSEDSFQPMAMGWYAIDDHRGNAMRTEQRNGGPPWTRFRVPRFLVIPYPFDHGVVADSPRKNFRDKTGTNRVFEHRGFQWFFEDRKSQTVY